MKRVNLGILSWVGVLGIVLRKYNSWFLLLCLFFILALIPTDKNLSIKKYKEYYKTNFLSNFNPFTLVQMIKQLIGEWFLILKSSKKQTTQNEYILPFVGSWFVARGGVTKESSHSWELITQRYAYDFVIQKKRKSYTDDKKNIKNYYCYQSSIIASHSGVIISVNNKTRDYKKVGDFSIDWKTNNFAGNYIIIKHPNKEYSFYAHLKKNSLKVKVGDKVNQGQILALCGNSGHSTEPHLHFQVMNSRNLFFGKSLMIQFKNVIENNEKKVKFINSGVIVKNENNKI